MIASIPLPGLRSLHPELAMNITPQPVKVISPRATEPYSRLKSLLEEQLSRALATMKRSPALKCFSPGVHKFLWRNFLRLRSRGTLLKVPLFFGSSMDIVLPETISESLYLYGFFDDLVTGMAIQCVNPGDTVLDIGAHFGYFSLLFSHLTGKTGRVVS